ncbi:MAG: serine protein kinase PrkA, partial [Thermodesulfobacteriota bacterium]|nr:serine protein kinase PrkA [Thermodesulfobacteriota bacterium]
MDNQIRKALKLLDCSLKNEDEYRLYSSEEFLKILSDRPHLVIRSVFQVFYDMIRTSIDEGIDEYPDDPESINYKDYDCSKLFVEGSDQPFFADRLFANKLVNLVEAMKRGTQQNRIYIFEGPHGSGKSTFLNNLLMKFEQYANTELGSRFETVWRLDRNLLGGAANDEALYGLEKLVEILNKTQDERLENSIRNIQIQPDERYIEVPCPSHDNPILMIPKTYRRSFFEELFRGNEFKERLFTQKEYDWVFRDSPCTVCSSLYTAIVNRLKNPRKAFEMLYARRSYFNRRLGNGITVFSPGDKPRKNTVLDNEMIQKRINSVFKDSNEVRYIYSRYAKTNNGIHALMDIKSHNKERLVSLHNIISEGVHKVDDIEENVTSLFLALMNPEDKEFIRETHSFSDRIERISFPYVMDLKTEVKIYRNVFGGQIDQSFLPMVLHNFARVIIASRLNPKSEAMSEWIEDPKKYSLYCDENMLLLKMEIYTGYIPLWLSDQDRKGLTAKRRRRIIGESEIEGKQGCSGRDSIKLFGAFYSTYAKEDRLINMSVLCKYFKSLQNESKVTVPEGFLESLQQMYDYTILQQVKESLYYYNEAQIAKDIQNYIFAVNFEKGSVETCRYTGDKLIINDDFFRNIEHNLFGSEMSEEDLLSFRKDIQREYTAKTLTQEIMLEGTALTGTKLFQSLHGRYVHNLKERVFDPFLENRNFRQAIKDFNKEDFNAYDKRIRNDVKFLIKNLCAKYRYTRQGAQEVCIYVLDNDLPKKFKNR